MRRFEGKKVLVTGASRGIGRAIALAFAREGATLVLASRKKEDLDRVATEAREIGAMVHVIPTHMGRIDEVSRLAGQAWETAGRLDVLVNNAATNPVFGPLLQTTPQAWDKIMEVNLKGPFFLSQGVARRMMDSGGGSIVNLSSIAGLMSATWLGTYGISKAAIVQMTRQMAREWAAGGVRVNSIAPGVIETDFSRAILEDQSIRAEALKNVAMGRHGQPPEIASIVLFLASSEASYVTGQVLIADGGGIC